MKILFILSIDDIYTPEKPLRSQGQIQFGISYISSLLKKHNHTTRLLILSRMLGKKNKAAIDSYIQNFSPRLILFTAVSTEYPFIADHAEYIKKTYPEIFLLIGGPHASLNPEESLRSTFDAVCIGEGEYPVLELISQLEKGIKPKGIHNLWIKHGREIKKTPTRPFLEKLDTLPFPDREMWQEWIEDTPESEYAVLLGRGCPFQCTYCCNHALRKLSTGPYVRFRSPENIIKEIGLITSGPQARTNIYLEIETIGANKSWVNELCERLEGLNAKRLGRINFSTNLRITPKLDIHNIFSAFKKANFKSINIGVESGSERVRSEILNRNYSNQDIIDAVHMAKKLAIKVNFYNLIGVPGETLADAKETIALNRKCQPDKTFNHIFFPYPGTQLYTLCREKGFLPEEIDTDLERCKATLNLPGFSRKEIQNVFIWFDYHVYKGQRPLKEILRKVLISKCRSNSLLHLFYRKLTYSAIFKHTRKKVK